MLMYSDKINVLSFSITERKRLDVECIDKNNEIVIHGSVYCGGFSKEEVLLINSDHSSWIVVPMDSIKEIFIYD